MARGLVSRAAQPPSLDLIAARDGVVVPVIARPRARRDALAGSRAGALLIDVVAAPEAGSANAGVIEVLAALLCVPRAAIVLTVGGAARRKRFRIAGIDAATARDRLASALRADP